MRKKSLCISFWIAAFGLPLIVNATVVPRMDLHDLTTSAEVIAQGHVVRHWSSWDASHRFIWTHYQFQVEDQLKGLPGRSTVISEPGGEVNGTVMKVDGVPDYRDGEEAVVFLHRTPLGYWRCYGLAQGKFSVSSAGGEKRVRTDVSAVDRAEPHRKALSRPVRQRPSVESLNGLTLAQFKQRVRQELNSR